MHYRAESRRLNDSDSRLRSVGASRQCPGGSLRLLLATLAWSARLATSLSSARAGAGRGAVLLIVTAVWWWRRARLLASVLEVSPFAISEVAADGSRRTILWSQVGWLKGRPRRRRLEVLTLDGQAALHIHYELVGFYHAVGLVLEYGGFTPNARSA